MNEQTNKITTGKDSSAQLPCLGTTGSLNNHDDDNSLFQAYR